MGVQWKLAKVQKQGRLMYTRKIKGILRLRGKGEFLDDSVKVAEVEYSVQIKQEIINGLPGLYITDSKFTTIGKERTISEESQLTLRLQDGNEIEIELVNYQWGDGSFTLTNNAIDQCLSQYSDRHE